MDYVDAVAIATIIKKNLSVSSRGSLVSSLGRYITKELRVDLSENEWQNLCYDESEGIPKGLHEENKIMASKVQKNPNRLTSKEMDVIIKRAQKKLTQETGYGIKEVCEIPGQESG